MRALKPAAPGLAMLVPLRATVPQLLLATLLSADAETMLEPGTVTSGLMRPSSVGPQLLKEAIVFALAARSVAPTETALLAVDGLPTLRAPGPEFPAAKKIWKSL